MVANQIYINSGKPLKKHDFASCLKSVKDATKQITKVKQGFEDKDERRRGNGRRTDQVSP